MMANRMAFAMALAKQTGWQTDAIAMPRTRTRTRTSAQVPADVTSGLCLIAPLPNPKSSANQRARSATFGFGECYA